MRFSGNRFASAIHSRHKATKLPPSRLTDRPSSWKHSTCQYPLEISCGCRCQPAGTSEPSAMPHCRCASRTSYRAGQHVRELGLVDWLTDHGGVAQLLDGRLNFYVTGVSGAENDREPGTFSDRTGGTKASTSCEVHVHQHHVRPALQHRLDST